MVYTPLDMIVRGLGDICRASVFYLHTEAELDWLAEAVAAARNQSDKHIVLTTSCHCRA
jgi:hypothetical protein